MNSSGAQQPRARWSTKARVRVGAARLTCALVASVGVTFIDALAAPANKGAGAVDHAAPGGLGWLAGCWRTRDGATTEVWSQAGRALYFGWNTQSNDGAIVFFEQLRIELDGDDGVYVAYPRGHPPTRFTLSALKEQSATFTNPDHDFPQRIAYRIDGDELTAEISLLSGEQARSWRYSRCL